MFPEIKKELQKSANPEKAKKLQRFFKTGKGEYGEGDIFLGIIVPKQREIVKNYYKTTTLADIKKLLQSKIHEYRLTALLFLVAKYNNGNEPEKKQIASLYLINTKWVNNWDLVDLSAPNILGAYFLDKQKKIIYKLAESKNLWERRIAILATFVFIKNNNYEDSLKIAEILLNDRHDLIQKATGWMLREIGKRNIKVELSFLNKYYKIMPRTMLHYAIERFQPEERRRFLNKGRRVKSDLL